MSKQSIQSLLTSKDPVIMGILNVTPDSFSDGSQFIQFGNAMNHAEQMLSDGADIIDVGGESTRPGASEVNSAEEIKRVLPLVKGIKALGGVVSVDTSKPEVMAAAIDAGADMINDVRALTMNGATEVIANTQTPVCLMHMQGKPADMQNAPCYRNVLEDVTAYLKERIEVCEQAGISRDLIAVDPGFGFGKTLSHNLELLNQLKHFQQLKVPVLAGLSRKSMLGQITGREVAQRLAGSLAVALIAMQNGAQIIRVHDVAQTLDIKKIYLATRPKTVD